MTSRFNAFRRTSFDANLKTRGLTSLEVVREPDLARRGQIEPPRETPLLAAWNAVAPVEGQRGLCRDWRGRAMYRRGQLVPDPRDRDDDPVIVSQELPYLGNGRGQRSIHDRRARPHGLEQLGFGDHFTCVVEQRAKDFKRLGLDLHWRAPDPEHPAGLIELAIAESPTGDPRCLAFFRVS